MDVDLATLPEGVDPTAIRKCKELPSGGNITAPTGALDKRDCYNGPLTYGCGVDNHICWKTCNTAGSGQWCWTAWNKGFGAWRSCAQDQDCFPSVDADCGQGGCAMCGCSC
ncbi:hypothetical protein AURDEDRAFT_102628 [Auricularia subglabra TFB-10046 SS5]|nr:hypothetical protein AURDEDRAFT_102628 [Auricularia subglabra TFB-10046 SS5]